MCPAATGSHMVSAHIRFVLLFSTLVGRGVGETVNIVNTNYELSWVRNLTGLDHAGYAFISDVLPGKLVLTQFGAAPFFGKSLVSLVDLAAESHAPLATNIDWPNEATIVDETVFGFKAVIVGAGFLVPSHTTGGIWVMEASEEPVHLKEPVKITKDMNKPFRPDSGWFYHKASLVDMNGDGLLDIVTSRAEFSVESWNDKRGKFVWLEQPKADALSGQPWAEHEIADGPDFIFSLKPAAAGLSSDGTQATQIEACAAEFIAKRVQFISGSEATGYKSRVVDDQSGPGFGCMWSDLNGDGKLDIIATNHLNQNGSVYAYSWDGDLKDEATQIHKHVLATGFSAATTSAGQASPGDAIPFFISTKDHQGKPCIFVSGDNGNDIYILVPMAPTDPNDWTYAKQRLAFLGADVGRIAIADTDGDGYNELFIPAYDLGMLVHYKFGPKSFHTVVV